MISMTCKVSYTAFYADDKLPFSTFILIFVHKLSPRCVFVEFGIVQGKSTLVYICIVLHSLRKNTLLTCLSASTTINPFILFYFLFYQLTTRAGSPQQREPMTVGP